MAPRGGFLQLVAAVAFALAVLLVELARLQRGPSASAPPCPVDRAHGVDPMPDAAAPPAVVAIGSVSPGGEADSSASASASAAAAAAAPMNGAPNRLRHGPDANAGAAVAGDGTGGEEEGVGGDASGDNGGNGSTRGDGISSWAAAVFERHGVALPPKETGSRGLLYVFFDRVSPRGCTWKMLAGICFHAANGTAPGFTPLPAIRTAQACEAYCCEAGEECEIYQFHDQFGCWVSGNNGKRCKRWISADRKVTLGWTGGRLGRGRDNIAKNLEHLERARDGRLDELVRSVASVRQSCDGATGGAADGDGAEATARSGRSGADFGVTLLVPSHRVIPERYRGRLALLGVDIVTPAWVGEPPDPAFTTSWWFRLLALASSPYEQTVQLDVDTVLCECFDRKGLWDLFAERYDWAATHAPSLFHDSDKTNLEAGGDEKIPRAFVQYNNAVVAYRWTDGIATMLARALLALKDLPQYGLRDQAALRQALWQTPAVHDYVLPDIWQCRVPKGLAAVHCGNHQLLTQSVQKLSTRGGSGDAVGGTPTVAGAATDITATCAVLHGHSVTRDPPE